MGFKEVPSEDPNDTHRHFILESSDTPERWSEYYVLAHEFDGYAAFPDDLAERANQVGRDWREHQELPEDLDLLRACLFYEARRSRFIEGYPNEGDMEYIDPLVEKIKKIEGNIIDAC